MATNWILSRRKYSLAAEADAIVDLFVGGLGPERRAAATLGAPHAGEHAHTDRQRSRRRHDGRADCRALRQCRRPRAAARRHPRRRARRPGTRAQAQAGSVLHPRRSPRSCEPAASTRTCRPSPPPTGSSKPSSNASTSSRRSSSASTAIVRRTPIVSSNTSGIPIAAIVEGRSAVVPGPRARHPLLQSAAVSAAGRDHPDGRHRPAGREDRCGVLRSPPRQGRGRRQGHAELHRQPHRPLRRDADPPGVAGSLQGAGRRVLNRRNRRHHRPGHRPAEERDVSDDGPGWHRRAGARRLEPGRQPDPRR